MATSLVTGDGRGAKLRLKAAHAEQRRRAKKQAAHHAKPNTAKHHTTKHHTKHKHRPKHHKPAAHHVAARAHGTLPVALPVAPAAPRAPSPSPAPAVVSTITAPQAHRLLWRAGFGPTPGQVPALAGQPLQQVVFSLTRPSGPATLSGPAPVDEEGNPLDPANAWGQDHLWWLDRMVRSDQQLVERLTFIFHDWFANSNAQVNSQQQMLDQNNMFRSMVFGSFHDLFLSVTTNPAMLIFLNGTSNNKWDPNENYAREMMELFSLGADRGAYTEDDVREMARALTGWRNDWSAELGNHNFRFDPTYHDTGLKTVFGQTGRWNYEDAVRLCVSHPLHASFFVTKLWGVLHPQRALGSDPRLAAGPVHQLGLQHPRGRRGDPAAPGLLRRARAADPARRLQRRPPALDLPPDRHDGLGMAVRQRRAAAVLPAQRRRLGLQPLA